MPSDKTGHSPTVIVENERLRLSVRKDSGQWCVLHKATGRQWDGPSKRLCSMTIWPNDGRPVSGFDTDSVTMPINRYFDSVEADDQSVKALFSRPESYNVGQPEFCIEFSLSLVGEDNVELSYRVVKDDPAWRVHSVAIIDDCLCIFDRGDYAVLPVYQGEMIPVGSSFSYLPEDRPVCVRTSDVIGTYPGVGKWNMAMLGLVKGDSTVVCTWDDPDVEPGIVGRPTVQDAAAPQVMHSMNTDIGRVEAQSVDHEITTTIVLNRQAKSLRLHFMQEADHVGMAKYYRRVVMDRGNFVTLKDKIRSSPEAAKNVGAMRFTVAPMWGRSTGAGWAMSVEPGHTRCDYTFDEVAEVAEHLKNDLGIDRAQCIVKGWTHRGYDMDYPDVLPAAEPCGGNEGLTDASKRVQALGWLFGLHDNSLLQFEECPSTDPADALVRADGTRVQGGTGIPRWRLQMCSPVHMMKTAKRNYPQYKELFGLNFMYTDQIAALPLFESFDEEHPLTRRQCIEVYRELIAYMRALVHTVASEIMDEWAVPMFDSMGAMMGKVHGYARAIPLFELVYRECVNLDGWAWGDLYQASVVNCIPHGRMPYLPYPQRHYLRDGIDTNVRGQPYQIWWLKGYHADNLFLRGDQGWGEDLNWYDRMVKNVYEVTSPLNELTAHEQMTDHAYLAPDRQVEQMTYANGLSIVCNRSEADFTYEDVLLPPAGFVAAGPTFVAFYAKRYGGVDYPDGALFTCRALDGQPLPESRQVRVYHGFGQVQVRVGDKVFEVQREAVVDPRT